MATTGTATDGARTSASARAGDPAAKATGENEDERGFFERAGEEIRSWFGDEDDRGPGREQERGRSGGWSGGSSWDRDRGEGRSTMPRSSGGGWSSSPDRDREGGYGRMGRDFEGRSSFGGMAQGGRSGGSFDRESERGFGPSRGGGEWRSMSNQDRSRMGRYGGQGASRSDRDWGRSGHAQSWGEANRGQSGSRNRDRDRDEDQEFLGLWQRHRAERLAASATRPFGSSQDDHYRSWRDRQTGRARPRL